MGLEPFSGKDWYSTYLQWPTDILNSVYHSDLIYSSSNESALSFSTVNNSLLVAPADKPHPEFESPKLGRGGHFGVEIFIVLMLRYRKVTVVLTIPIINHWHHDCIHFAFQSQSTVGKLRGSFFWEWCVWGYIWDKRGILTVWLRVSFPSWGSRWLPRVLGLLPHAWKVSRDGFCYVAKRNLG